MIGFHFSHFDPNEQGKSKFDQLLDMFMQLLTYTNGDVAEALQWLNQLDQKYELTDNEYGMGDFVDDLKDKGYITEKEENGDAEIVHLQPCRVEERRQQLRTPQVVEEEWPIVGRGGSVISQAGEHR